MPKAAPKSQPTHEGSDRWAGFQPGLWQKQIDVRDFIQSNVTPYYGDELFLEKPTQRTAALWKKLQALFIEERKKGVLDVSPIPSSITAHDAGYIDKNNEIIVGLQTEAPLKRAIMPNGGFRLVATALKAYGYEPDPAVVEAFTKYRKTHNDAVFDAYSDDVRRCRSSHLLTGLPDAYGRGRIIGDYRRVALYGVDRLIARKKEEKKALDKDWPSDDIIRDREELAEQIRALGELKEMAAKYGYDISGPARTAKEAVQWLYFGYLASVKEQNGAAMSLGRTSTFLDIYFERDIHAGQLTEREAQEIVDDFVIKLRIVRFLRTPEYDDIFAGDPTWVTESIGGMSEDGRPLVTKTSFRYLQTLYNLGPAPEPNLTIWYTPRLPEPFRRFTAKVAIDTSSIQFESDETMRRAWGDDGGIACCVSPMMMGKQMQFFGARSNLAKCLLYAINGGRDELSGEQIAPAFAPVQGEYLDFDDVLKRFDHMMDWLAGVYVSAMNVIHYMHDKYAYERIEMALHDYAPLRTMAFGIAGLSVVADSLSAIKHAKVKVIRDETGLIVDYKAEGGFPAFGNNDNRVDHLATWLVSTFMNKLRTHKTYRNAMHTQSVLTITSNVVYGRGTGNTPDGRRQGEPFAPGANPMHGRDSHGIHASAASVAKIPYRDAADGISLTTTVVPSGLGRGQEERISNLTAMLDAFFGSTGYHVNVNVLNREMLIDAMDHPERYPSLTIRVSGYAVNFVQLTREQQMDVITRTFHGSDVAGAAINTSGPPRARPVENRASRPEHKNGEAGGNVVKFPLEAESPYELRVGLAEKFSEKEMRAAVNSGDVGFLHSFTTGSAVDGPGVRLVAWTSLCMFRCQFCHNPDTWTLSNGMPVTISRASEELRKYAGGLKAMHGGFTLSGGEPFMQARFAAKLFAAAKWLGIHTAVETNGFYGDKLSDDELRNIDLVILDMKGFSQAQHQRVTAGIDNKPVHEFARRLSALKRPMWLRYVLVPGLTDVDEEMEQIAHFGASLGVVERVEILPFHQLGRYKWEKLGLDYRLAQTEPPSPASVRHAVDVFKAAGLNAS